MSWLSPWTKYPGYENASGLTEQGHPAYARWMTDLEHVNIGVKVPQDRLTTKGGYKGAQMICAMGPWATMGQWKDNAIRFDGALMAVPYVDYFEHSQDMTFLKETAYPFLKPQAEFYASYIVLNQNGTYDVPLACAQEACGPRQLEHVIDRRLLNTIRQSIWRLLSGPCGRLRDGRRFSMWTQICRKTFCTRHRSCRIIR